MKPRPLHRWPRRSWAPWFSERRRLSAKLVAAIEASTAHHVATERPTLVSQRSCAKVAADTFSAMVPRNHPDRERLIKVARDAGYRAAVRLLAKLDEPASHGRPRWTLRAIGIKLSDVWSQRIGAR